MPRLSPTMPCYAAAILCSSVALLVRLMVRQTVAPPLLVAGHAVQCRRVSCRRKPWLFPFGALQVDALLVVAFVRGAFAGHSRTLLRRIESPPPLASPAQRQSVSAPGSARPCSALANHLAAPQFRLSALRCHGGASQCHSHAVPCPSRVAAADPRPACLSLRIPNHRCGGPIRCASPTCHSGPSPRFSSAQHSYRGFSVARRARSPRTSSPT